VAAEVLPSLTESRERGGRARLQADVTRQLKRSRENGVGKVAVEEGQR